MAAKTTATVFVSLLLFFCLSLPRSTATRRGLNVGLRKESSLVGPKETMATAAGLRRKQKLELAYGTPLIFAMLPRGPVPPSGPIGGINGGGNN
ncbi:hypothetical protein BHE74_00025564 [Ensete ventricosum]|uniref:Uncharacterized protein n=1 Tax=Ensete ventricosum TaxID=4639 RepID=A0A426XF11_ENSVE|nr:hypothetical protein B296_00029955 [Ensete ventricosum]RWW32672.1 hypothetical protein GW17_00002640 [Ensete ventricosum]RWW67023.1 hypothetical protein BHE74_00025564 [Ensete ventricosum]RZR80352.1 hypothetical protein BHM03_00006378 [Ensete ventricosum]